LHAIITGNTPGNTRYQEPSMKRLLSLLLLGMAAVAPASDLDGHAAHEHGVAHLTLAIEQQTLMIELESPADNLVGFENAPRKAREKSAVLVALAQLRQPSILKLNTEAGCSSVKITAEDPFAETGSSTHQDFDAEYRFQCQAPGKLVQLDASPFFRAFPRLRALKVDYALPAGQGSATLTPRAPRIRLVP